MKILAFCLSLVLPLSVIAGQIEPKSAWDTMGIRGGFPATDTASNPSQFELYASYQLPWRWGAHWILGTRFNISLGVIKGAGDNSTIGTFGQALTLQKSGSPISLSLGEDIALLSDDELGQDDFGGLIHFISHIDLNLRLNRAWEVGYRFQHMSNAGLDDHNPGLDLHLFQLGYRF